MSKRITILGAGPGGYVAALRGAELGARVTVIENDTLGGTCLNWGCIPTKTLKSSAEAARKAERLKTYGIDFKGEIRADFAAIMARKNKVVSTLVSGIDKAFKAGKVELIKGTGAVVNPHLVRVVDSEGVFHEVAGDKLILATGSRPQSIPNLSFDGKHILSSNDVLKLETIPRKIIVLGGGVIGVEFAFKASAIKTMQSALAILIGLTLGWVCIVVWLSIFVCLSIAVCLACIAGWIAAASAFKPTACHQRPTQTTKAHSPFTRHDHITPNLAYNLLILAQIVL